MSGPSDAIEGTYGRWLHGPGRSHEQTIDRVQLEEAGLRVVVIEVAVEADRLRDPGVAGAVAMAAALQAHSLVLHEQDLTSTAYVEALDDFARQFVAGLAGTTA